MSVYRASRSQLWVYDFWFQGRRYTLGRGLSYKADAVEAEATLKRTLRRRAAGLEALAADETPTFSNWAVLTLKWQRTRKRIKRPDEVRKTLRMILGFWGAKPESRPVPGAPYHNLRLGDPIREPEWIGRFEDWMTARKLSGSRKNHYRSACSMLYRVALQPEYRTRAGVRENPFRDILRDQVQRRTVVLDPDTITKWIDSAPVPAVVAVALGALAPALRFQNVAELRRDQLSPARDFLTVPHKTDRETGRPLTVAISTGLREVIAEVERVSPKDPYVVPLPGRERYWALTKIIRKSIIAAGLPYGRRRKDGITFHSLRHAMHTWMARQGLTSDERQVAMGQTTTAMASWYTHLGGADTVRAMEMLGKLPLARAAVARLRETKTANPARARKTD